MSPSESFPAKMSLPHDARMRKAEAGFILRLQMTMPTIGSAHQAYDQAHPAGLHWNDTLITDSSWVYSDTMGTELDEDFGFDDSGWKSAVSIGKLGDKPWGDHFCHTGGDVRRSPSPSSLGSRWNCYIPPTLRKRFVDFDNQLIRWAG